MYGYVRGMDLSVMSVRVFVAMGFKVGVANIF